MQIDQMLQVASSIGTVGLLLTIVIMNMARGNSASAREALELRKEQIQALRDEVDRQSIKHKEQITELTTRSENDRIANAQELKELLNRVGELTGALASKEGEMKRLTDILSNRNPEMDSFFKNIATSIEASNKFYAESLPMIKNSDQCLTSLTPVLSHLGELMKKMDEHLIKFNDKE